MPLLLARRVKLLNRPIHELDDIHRNPNDNDDTGGNELLPGRRLSNQNAMERVAHGVLSQITTKMRVHTNAVPKIAASIGASIGCSWTLLTTASITEGSIPRDFNSVSIVFFVLDIQSSG